MSPVPEPTGAGLAAAAAAEAGSPGWRSMLPAEFSAWRAEAVPGYAASQVAAGRWAAEGALDESEREHQRLLPQGLQTPGHAFFVMTWAGAPAGHCWVADQVQAGQPGLYIYGIEVLPWARRRGLARYALAQVDALARERGLAHVGLHVFGNNAGARALYREAGFDEVSVVMRKTLQPVPGGLPGQG